MKNREGKTSKIMRENTKFIVAEVNKLLSKNYNVIYFNSLHPKELLQVLKEVLIMIQGQNGEAAIDSRGEILEETPIYILSVLRILHYQPQTDPATFRRGLIRGNPDIIQPILTWLLSHVDIIQKRLYLSRFLIKIEIPAEHLNDADVSPLYEQYTALIDRFKSVHKEREIGKKNLENACELTMDLKTMEKEKEAVTIRIEKMRLKAEVGIHLLDTAKALRIEKDKERDLTLQEEQEKEVISRLQSNLQRREREIQILKKDESEVTIQTLLQHLSEVITVQTIVTSEKLPAEINAKKNQIQALQSAKQYSYLDPEQITALRNKLDVITKEIQNLVEFKISKSNMDKIELFRQQAAAVANIKRNLLEKLEKIESSLQELLTRLEEKRGLSKLVMEDKLPKGAELKKYINRLKTRGTVYKHCKSELAWLNAENSLLYRTANILEHQYNQCNLMRERLETVKSNTPSNFTEENAPLMNRQLCSNIAAFKLKLVPLINGVQSLRTKCFEFEQQQEKVKTGHSKVESSISARINDLQLELKNNKVKMTKNIEKKGELQRLISNMKIVEERIKQNTEDPAISDPGKKIKAELNAAIQTKRSKIKNLLIEKDRLKQTIAVKEKQTQMWNNILLLFQCKIECAKDIKQLDGIVIRRGGVETLVLQ